MKINKNKTTLVVLVLMLFHLSCKKDNDKDEIVPQQTTSLTPFELVSPPYFPKLISPSENPLTKEGIALGRMLYYDPILSNNGLSCSSCHDQSNAFSNTIANSLSHQNLAWNNKFLWNGAIEGTLEDAMHFEVAVFFNTDISKLNNNIKYLTLFKKVFNTDQITSKEVEYALAQYMRTQSSTNSKFDKFLRHETDLTTSEMKGFQIFNTEKGDCFHCHSLGLFNDNAFHNIGIDSIFNGVNAGRYNITSNQSDLGKFKTPTLRNIELTAPYMHDGRMATLEDVIEHYNSKVKLSATLDPIFSKPNHKFGLELNLQEKADLVSFLKTLTDQTFTNDTTLSNPF